MTIAVGTYTITAEDQWSGEVWIDGKFNFILKGTWAAIVHVQRYFKLEQKKINGLHVPFKNWEDVDTFLVNGAFVGEEPEGAFYRFGIKEGNYTSGEVEGRLSQ